MPEVAETLESMYTEATSRGDKSLRLCYDVA